MLHVPKSTATDPRSAQTRSGYEETIRIQHTCIKRNVGNQHELARSHSVSPQSSSWKDHLQHMQRGNASRKYLVSIGSQLLGCVLANSIGRARYQCYFCHIHGFHALRSTRYDRNRESWGQVVPADEQETKADSGCWSRAIWLHKIHQQAACYVRIQITATGRQTDKTTAWSPSLSSWLRFNLKSWKFFERGWLHPGSLFLHWQDPRLQST